MLRSAGHGCLSEPRLYLDLNLSRKRLAMVTIQNERGFTYLALMFSIALIGLTLTAAAKPWKTVVQREREADLLAYGVEIQQAIGAYSARMKQGRVMPGEVYPHSLEELTRQPNPLLRKVYVDPISKSPFEVVRAPTGGIMGVRSRSLARPIRQHEFPAAVRHFDGVAKYQDWIFQHPNASGSTVLFPGAPAIGQTVVPVPPVPATTVPMQPNATGGQNLPGFQSGGTPPPEQSPSNGSFFAPLPTEPTPVPPPTPSL